MANEFIARNGLIAQNNSTITGSLNVTGGITGSLLGTSSYTTNALTASYVVTAQTASYVLNAVSASYATNALSSSYAVSTAPVFPYTGSAIVSGSLRVTGSVNILSPGAASTDIPFKVRNSADTKNIIEIRGDSETRFNGTAAVGNYVGIKNYTSYDANIDLMAGDSVKAQIFIDVSSNANLNRGLNFWNPGIVGSATSKINNVIKSGLGAYGAGYGFNWAVTSNTSGIYTQSERAMFLTSQNALVLYTSSVSPTDIFSEKGGAFEIYASSSTATNGIAAHFNTNSGSTVWIGSQTKLINVTGSSITTSTLNASGNTTLTSVTASGIVQTNNYILISRGTDAYVTNLNVNSGTANTSAFQINTDQPNSKVVLNSRNSYTMGFFTNDVERALLSNSLLTVRVPTTITGSTIVSGSLNTSGSINAFMTGSEVFNIGNAATTGQRQVRIGQGTAWVDIGNASDGSANAFISFGQTTNTLANSALAGGQFSTQLNSNTQVLLRISNGTKATITNTLFSTTVPLTVTGSLIATGGITGSVAFVSQSYFAQGILSSNYQSIPQNTDTVIQFADHYDPQNWYNPSTYRFTPTVAGYYNISIGAWFSQFGDPNQQCNIQARINGSTFMILQNQTINNNAGQTFFGTKIQYFNGSTDYADFTAYQSADASNNLQLGTANGSGTWFSAIRLNV